jgi:hypothetical protein
MKWLFSVHWAFIASLWYLGSGIFHIAGVLLKNEWNLNHASSGLLAESLLLMLSGTVVFVCYLMLLNKIQCGGVISILVSSFMLLSCIAQLPSIQSFVTMVICIFLIIASIKAIRSFPDIYQIMQNYK